MKKKIKSRKMKLIGYYKKTPVYELESMLENIIIGVNDENKIISLIEI